MNRAVGRCCLVLVCLVACAAPAAAGDWWDAMEAWSGPGPFKHKYGNYFATVCDDLVKKKNYRLKLEDYKTRQKENRLAPNETEPEPPLFPFRIANEYPDPETLRDNLVGKPRNCLYLNTGSYRVEKDPAKGYDAVDLQTYDFGLLFEVRRWLDVGFGMGWIDTESHGVGSTKFAITPIRIAVRPGCFFVNCGSIEHRVATHLARVVTFSAHERWLPQGVSSADFGAPEVAYSVPDEWLTSGGLLTLDLGELFAGLWAMH